MIALRLLAMGMRSIPGDALESRRQWMRHENLQYGFVPYE
jgi:hypothetical protein